MRRGVLLICLLLLLPAPARAQDAVDWLSGALVTTTVLDAHSTLWALDRGAREANPAVQWVETHPEAFLVMKAASVAFTVVAARHASKRHRVLSITTLVILNGVSLWAAERNYRHWRHR